MTNLKRNRTSEHGSAGVKFLLIAVILFLFAHAGYNYIPVAYEGANFKQEMETAVVKGLAATGQMKPMDIVTGTIRRAASDNNIPSDAIIEIKPSGTYIQAHVVYTKRVNILPFGLYKYSYNFNHVARPTGYLLKE